MYLITLRRIVCFKRKQIAMDTHAKHLIKQINQHANEAKSDWWNRHLHNAIQFAGVTMPQIKSIVREWKKENPLSVKEYLEIADLMLSKEIAEYKIAGILIYQKCIIGKIEDKVVLYHVEKLFNDNLVYDKFTCSKLAQIVIAALINDGNPDIIDQIIDWSASENIWLSRCAMLGFANCKELKQHHHILDASMRLNIKRDEALHKTAVAELLRKIALFDPIWVGQFIDAKQIYITPEVKKIAFKLR